MGREIRFVKEGWEHPKEDNTGFKPLVPREYLEADDVEYLDEEAMPDWKEEEMTHMMMYEDTSEGTPISPPFPREDKEGLAKWLFDNNTSAFGNSTASYEGWLATIEAGWATGMIISGNTIQNGVDAMINKGE